MLRCAGAGGFHGGRGEEGETRGMFADRVETGEVYCGAETCAQGGGYGAAPEGRDYAARRGTDLGECGAQRVGAAGLLDSGFE